MAVVLGAAGGSARGGHAGRRRPYGYVIAIRAVTSDDAKIELPNRSLNVTESPEEVTRAIQDANGDLIEVTTEEGQTVLLNPDHIAAILPA